MSELYSDTTPEYIVIDMTDPCYAIGALYKDIATLKAELAKERKEHIEDEAVYVGCIAERAALVDAARTVVSTLESAKEGYLDLIVAIDHLAALLPQSKEKDDE